MNGERITKPGLRFDADAVVSARPLPAFVSRGGEKLAHALDEWHVSCETTWIDAGCSTGGFTDCLLQRGASLVYAVDVGVNQLDWRLRQDPRVRVMEGTNVMDIAPGSLEPAPQRIAADLSFRSLRGAARHLLELAQERWGIFLVKPQFEWKSPVPGFRGVVKEPAAVLEIVEALLDDLRSEGVGAEKAALSPVKGRKGNRELLLLLRRGPAGGGPAGAEQDTSARLPDGLLEKLILEGCP